MSGDMSVFQKMKEKITDEVNSATSKLQNMQLIDQLASSIGQQIKADMPPNQILPQPPNAPSSSSFTIDRIPRVPSGQFSLIDDGLSCEYNEQEESNVEISPQHELFDENAIRRLQPSTNLIPNKNSQSGNGTPLEEKKKDKALEANKLVEDNKKTVNENHVINNQEDKSGSVSPQPVSKSSAKIRDLERILAKCKESLRQKNSQIQSLKDSLSEVGKFMDHNQELKRELGELRESHERWTVLIAENKRVMHQELECKNNEIEKIKSEAKDIQSKLNDSYNNVRQLKSIIQDLESRLVNTSAAHQKERESLIKELTMAKNNAIKQFQKEHELNLERVKLDLERSIEALKVQIFAKDEHLVKTVTMQQQLEEENRDLIAKYESTMEKLTHQSKELEDLKLAFEEESKKSKDLEKEISSLKEQIDTTPDNDQLISEREELKQKIESLNARMCQVQEQSQQEIHELNAQLNLMTTANDDQEREIKSLRYEKDMISENLKSLKLDYEELMKKNESLARVLHENEAELQSQQDQLDQFSSMHQELDNLKKENNSMVTSLSQLKIELNDKNSEISSLKSQVISLSAKEELLKEQVESASKLVENFRSERDSIAEQNEDLGKQRRELDEQMVVRILSIMKNLETPNSSPGSDKSSTSGQLEHERSSNHSLPNPVNLLEDLSSIALDRSNAYVTSYQRLQAVLLDNSRMSEELERLREEINEINKEKKIESQCSLDETERLRTENQALVHDQRAYEERAKFLESEIDNLQSDLEAKQKLLDTYNEKIEALETKVTNLQSDSGVKAAHIAKLEHEYDDIKERYSWTSEALEAAKVSDNSEADEIIIRKLTDENTSLKQSIEDLTTELESIRSTSSNTNDHTYQIKALQRVLQQFQEENQRLKESQKNLIEQLNRDPMSLPDSTQFEYLKNIVHQFMLGKEPLVLARVISAVFKFDKSQVEQICKIQETVQAALGSGT